MPIVKIQELADRQGCRNSNDTDPMQTAAVARGLQQQQRRLQQQHMVAV